MRRRGRLGFGLALGAASVAMVVGTALAADRTVNISDFAFAPGSVTVNVGDTVTWTNADQVGHTATSGSDFDTGSIAPGGSGEVTFSTAGTYAYVCTIHPTMTGTVVVEAASGGGGGGTEPTTPPTDTASAVAAESSSDDAGSLVAWGLAVMGLAMMGMTLVLGRRAAVREERDPVR